MSGNPAGLHINGWSAASRDLVSRYPPHHLGILCTALEEEPIARWRDARPDGLLWYREWFASSEPGDVTYRVDRLLRNAERIRRFTPILLTPWNEERQSGDDLRRLNDDCCRAIERIQGEGYDAGTPNNSVTWPLTHEVLLILDALRLSRWHSFHEYDWPQMRVWNDRIGHYRELEAALPADARRPVLLTEFGLDRGVVGGRLGGWRESGLTGQEYADQSRRVLLDLRRDVAAVFFYQSGSGPDWASFEMAGEPAIESLLTEVYPVYQFVLGFAELARLMRQHGIDPGEPLENEQPRAYEDGFVVTRQHTTMGLMLWVKELNAPMFVSYNRRVVSWDGTTLRIA